MYMRSMAVAALAAGAVFTSTVAFAYVVALPAPVPVAFDRPRSPYALCAAEAQEQFLMGAAFDHFMDKCGRAAVARFCDESASARKLSGKNRTAYTRRCATELEEAER